MRVAIHQPNFLPWLGYFYKIARADVFVFLDDVQFSKGSYTNRVQIYQPGGRRWLTVPVKTAGKAGQLINEVSYLEGWVDKVLGSLDNSYGKTKFYRDYREGLLRILIESGNSLVNLNTQIIMWLCGLLGIPTSKIIRSSDLGIQSSSTDRLVDICGILGADEYLSGRGGSNYQDERLFEQAGVTLTYVNFSHPVYTQASDHFESGLSIVDVLFNCGEDSPDLLRNQA